FAKRFWPGASPLAGRLRLGTRPWATIVGVVPDVRPPGNDWDDRRMQVYETRPAAMQTSLLAMRSSLSKAALTAAVRRIAREIDPALKLRREAESAEEDISAFMAMHRFVLGLLGTFAVLAVVLAAIGVY